MPLVENKGKLPCLSTWGGGGGGGGERLSYIHVPSVQQVVFYIASNKSWAGPGNEATSHILCVYT